MTKCTTDTIQFSPLGRKKVQADFSGGEITSDAGVLLLREIDKQLGLTQKVDKVIPDPRDPNRTTHDQLSLLRQRMTLCMGHKKAISFMVITATIAFCRFTYFVRIIYWSATYAPAIMMALSIHGRY